nr:unnamed protein product [uncultured bacterium]
MHPLLTLTDSALVSDVCYSMLDWFDATGELPIWPLASGETKCMIGYHSVSIMADAYLKGIWPAAGDDTSAKRAERIIILTSISVSKMAAALRNRLSVFISTGADS